MHSLTVVGYMHVQDSPMEFLVDTGTSDYDYFDPEVLSYYHDYGRGETGAKPYAAFCVIVLLNKPIELR